MEYAHAQLKSVVEHASDITIRVACFDESTGDYDTYVLPVEMNIADDFLLVAQSVLTADADKRFRDYDPSYPLDRKSEVAHLQTSSHPQVSDILDRFPIESTHPIFVPDHDRVSRLRFYCATFRSGNHEVKFLNLFTKGNELQRRKGIKLFQVNRSFNRFQDKVFLFNESFDCYFSSHVGFIRSEYNFHRIFGYYDPIITKAGDAADKIGKYVPIANQEEFRNACLDNKVLARKIVQIAERPYLAELTYEDLAEIVDQFDVQVEFVEEDGKFKITAPSGQAIWEFVSLLDDAFVQSPLTNKQYEAPKKIERETAAT